MTIRLFVALLLITVVNVSRAMQNSDSVSVHARRQSAEKSHPETASYPGPMLPEVRSSKWGRCPECGMALKLVNDRIVALAMVDGGPGQAPETSSFSSSQIPDVQVRDQNGNPLNFYSDLIKGKTVAINFIFTTCTTTCPPLTAIFRRVQQDVVERGMEVQLISVSVDPTTDTPERLRDFAAKFRAGPGWTFVTGDKSAIGALLQSLGASTADRNDHTPMILIGNDAIDHWTRAYGLSSPALLVKDIAEAGGHK